jgi:hypothetical protein
MPIPTESPDPPERSPRRSLRVHGGVVVALWVAGIAQITGEFFVQPHSVETMRVMGSGSMLCISAGCTILTAWLVQHNTLDPYHDYMRALDHVYDAAYDKGRRDERAAPAAVVIAPRFGGSSSTWAESDLNAEDLPGGEPDDQSVSGEQTGT